MVFSVDNITAIRDILNNGLVANIIAYGQREYPNESCGFLLDGGAIHPARNVISNLYDRSLTPENAFLIDDESWKLASQRKTPIIGIYHTHTNGSPDMSESDKKFLSWRDLCYVIVALVDTKPVAAKLFWWEQDLLNELPINI